MRSDSADKEMPKIWTTWTNWTIWKCRLYVAYILGQIIISLNGQIFAFDWFFLAPARLAQCLQLFRLLIQLHQLHSGLIVVDGGHRVCGDFLLLDRRQTFGIGEIVDGDSQEDIQQYVYNVLVLTTQY